MRICVCQGGGLKIRFASKQFEYIVDESVVFWYFLSLDF